MSRPPLPDTDSIARLPDWLQCLRQSSWGQSLDTVTTEALAAGQTVDIAYLTRRLHISERQLLRRIKALSGHTTQQYQKERRLQYARQLLEQRRFATVTEVAYAANFSTPTYFSDLYEQRFGVRPTEYMKEE